MRYKVGDKVQVKSLDWYVKNKNEDGDIFIDDSSFVREMSNLCGKELTIKSVGDDDYIVKENHWSWGDGMLVSMQEESDIVKAAKELEKAGK